MNVLKKINYTCKVKKPTQSAQNLFNLQQKMQAKQIIGAVLLLVAIGYFALKFQDTLDMLSDNALSFFLLLVVVILLLYGFRKILSND